MANNEKIWSTLIHFGTNMWNEEGNTRGRENEPGAVASSTLRFSRKLWRDLLEHQQKAGVNMIILDLGEGLRYESHPELAVNGSWTREEMEAELAYARGMGFELIPKLNFSAGHDIWLKDYSRMLSTETYYRVCEDIIAEVCDIFKPRYFHLGMDEETYEHQRNYIYAAVRQYDLWWHDFYKLVESVERGGARPWVWSDYMWHHPDLFLQKMPRDVIQSNWYYEMGFGEDAGEWHKMVLGCFETLDRYGYDQVPTGSNYGTPENMEALTKYCTAHISDEHLLGFMQAPWVMTYESEHNRTRHWAAVDQLAASKKWYEGNRS